MTPEDSPQPDHPAQNPRDLHIPTRHMAHELAQHDTTTQILRNKVEAAYQKSSAPAADGPYQRTYTDSPVSYDWQQYHNAWQQYYQQYYQRYYVQQLHIQRQQQAADTPAIVAEQSQPATITGTDQAEASKRTSAVLKNQLIRTVRDRAGNVRRSRHFLPILSALAIGIVFLFLQYNRLLAANVASFVSPGAAISQNDTVLVDPAANASVGADPKVIVPKINLNVPVNYDVQTLDESAIERGLENGVVHYKLPGASSLPGQNGNVVLLGHSSQDIFNAGKYKFAFVLVDRLQKGDLFYIHYQSKRYIYRVTESRIINPNQVSTLILPADKPYATLVTCSPPGTALRRLLVFGEQISPDPATAAKASASSDQNQKVQIPGEGKTFLEKLFGF